MGRGCHVQAMLLAGLLAGCGGGGRTAAVAPLPIAEAVIGPAGGSLAFASGAHAGVALFVPPGAVAAPTLFTIEADVANNQIPSLFPVYRFEPRGLDLGGVPVTVTVCVGESLLDPDGRSDAVCFTQSAAGGEWSVLVDSTIDAMARTLTTTTTRLGDFVAWNGNLHRLMTQQFALLDPAQPIALETVAGVTVMVQNGSMSAAVGRGSLQSFWSSPAAENVLVIPGLLGSPADYLGTYDVVATLTPSVKNIVVLSYPSGLGVAATANALYDEIAARRQAGFGCSIIGHSLGGLVARYLIERSADDQERAGWREQDEPLAGTIAKLVLLGVPNAGADIGENLLDTLVATVPPADQFLLQAAHDISFRPDSIALQMNASYVDNATRYHVICGDIGGGTDGVVSVVSALALQLFAPETAVQFAIQHQALHVEAGINGVSSRIDLLLQMP